MKSKSTMSQRMIWLLLALCLGITSLGLCGLARADELYGRTKLVERQLIWLFIAIPAAVAIGRTPYQRFQQLSGWLYLGSIALLAVTLLMPPINGSRRWIPLGLFDFQASEPARIAFIMALASWLMYRSNHRTVAGLIPPVLLALVPMILIVREPDLDTALLFIPVSCTMLFTAGARIQHLLIAGGIGLACLPVLWTQMSAEQQSRIVSVIIQQDGGLAPAGDGFHLHQSKQVLALGGFWGSRTHDEPPVDDPTAWHLPASRTDFVFVMIGEYLGFPGCALLILLYVALVWSGLCIARSTREPFGRLVAIGIVTLIAEQTLLNTGMTVGLLPITGTTLPLCSYGGSSLISTYVAIGLLISIGRSKRFDVTGEPFLFTRQSLTSG